MAPILVVHNYYQQPGGEDAVFAAERELLRGYGHEVIEYTDDNDRVADLSKIGLAANTIWSRSVEQPLIQLLRRHRPVVAHFHNTFPLISPAAYYVVQQAGVPVVQTLHNYRLLCPGALFYRDGHVCEDCLGKTPPWPSIVHGCYRGSRAASTVVAIMLTVHRQLGTWTDKVDLYVALTEFARSKFIQGGLHAEKVVVKPNFVAPDPGHGEHRGGYILFVGRLSPEKGVETLLDAWDLLGRHVPLKVVGDGPLSGRVAAAAKRGTAIEWLGRLPNDRVLALMKEAFALVVPSVWYEAFPVVIVEAFATGLPIIAGNLGSLAAVVEHARTGLLFSPGDPADLAAQVDWAWVNPQAMAGQGRAARREYELKYTADRNYQMLREIYELAHAHR